MYRIQTNALNDDKHLDDPSARTYSQQRMSPQKHHRHHHHAHSATAGVHLS